MAFRLEIVHQGWLADVSPTDDLCSHGAIRLSIAGVPITDGTEDYGISESALAMLRTLRSDRIRGDALVECMILHGCGAMLGSGCGLGADWTTRHVRGQVILTDVVRYDAAGGGHPHEFPGVALEIPYTEYAAEVTRFAREARRPFEETPKRIAANELWEGEYLAFWEEYDRLLSLYWQGELPPLPI